MERSTSKWTPRSRTAPTAISTVCPSVSPSVTFVIYMSKRQNNSVVSLERRLTPQCVVRGKNLHQSFYCLFASQVSSLRHNWSQTSFVEYLAAVSDWSAAIRREVLCCKKPEKSTTAFMPRLHLIHIAQIQVVSTYYTSTYSYFIKFMQQTCMKTQQQQNETDTYCHRLNRHQLMKELLNILTLHWGRA